MLREQLDYKEIQRRKLEEELAQMNELIADNEEKLINLKKSNAVYLDNFARDKVNDRLSADMRQQELNNRAEKENGAKILTEIKFLLNKQKKTNDKLLQASLFRKELQFILEKLLKMKNLSPNQVQEIEKEMVEELKKSEYKARKLFGGYSKLT